MPTMAGLFTSPEKHNVSAIRSKPMRVLALGMSRTGTQTMSVALRQLGYDRVYHGHDMGDRIEDVRVWRDLWHRKQNGTRITANDFDKILSDCEAITDAPAVMFWSELMDVYPDAKVVLVLRDTESWYKSLSSVCIDPFCSKRSQFLAYVVRWKLFPYNVMVFLPELFMGYFRADTEQQFRANARSIYEQHNASIIARAESEGREILQMKLGQGWDPLCKYLQRPVPSSEFPRINEGAETRAMTYYGYSILSGLALLSCAGCFALLAAIIRITWLYHR